MRIVFMGTPDFAVPSLDILIRNKYDVVGVVTVPDKPAGRGQQLQESAVKKYALEKGLNILQPEKLKDEKFLDELRALKADLQFVVAFRMLPEAVWDMPPLGTYNLHGSLLPKYRGAAPINWAIINGETETGVSTFKLKHDIDTGNVLFREKVSIDENTTAGELHDKLMGIGAELVLKTVKAVENRNYAMKPQDEKEVIHAPKIFKDTCRINWNKPFYKVHNLVRGLSPYPGAFTEFVDMDGNTVQLKIYSTSKDRAEPLFTFGSVMTDGKSYIRVPCIGGHVEIKELQLQGKKRMGVEEFLRGYKFPEHCKFLS
jgi:methionyl-tRNA formyltransferase